MSDEGLKKAITTMRSVSASGTAIAAFSRLYRKLESGDTGLIYENSIDPLVDVTRFSDIDISNEVIRQALCCTAVLKLNGGLGTSMGLDRTKTLLEVREGYTFLDLIVQQIRSLRRSWGVELPVIFMNSFRTEAETLAALAPYSDLAVPGIPLTLVQNIEPKLRADDLTPVRWPADPSLEWCPPGHGDLFTVLYSTGVSKLLLERGIKYLFVSNGDNVGATPEGVLAAWFAQSKAPFALELCDRTINDRKGGHIAIRRSDNQLILRDAAMVAEEEKDFFYDWQRHRYFNTNNVWIDLRALQSELEKNDGIIPLPIICNRKTVDPTDPTSTEVIQLETAMGAALEVFQGATAVVVGRDRFLPVKTTNELLLLRSDLFDLTDEGTLLTNRKELPEISLSPYFSSIADFDARVKAVPSLKNATALRVQGDWYFAPGCCVVGDVELLAGEKQQVASGVIAKDVPA
ncbi:MAG: UTP--glucose-1-phosphate uridylyltransferase [Propionibacteriaceae bacterium]